MTNKCILITTAKNIKSPLLIATGEIYCRNVSNLLVATSLVLPLKITNSEKSYC